MTESFPELSLLEYVEALPHGHRARLELAGLLTDLVFHGEFRGDYDAIERLRRKRTVGADENPPEPSE